MQHSGRRGLADFPGDRSAHRCRWRDWRCSWRQGLDQHQPNHWRLRQHRCRHRRLRLRLLRSQGQRDGACHHVGVEAASHLATIVLHLEGERSDGRAVGFCAGRENQFAGRDISSAYGLALRHRCTSQRQRASGNQGSDADSGPAICRVVPGVPEAEVCRGEHIGRVSRGVQCRVAAGWRVVDGHTRHPLAAADARQTIADHSGNADAGVEVCARGEGQAGQQKIDVGDGAAGAPDTGARAVARVDASRSAGAQAASRCVRQGQRDRDIHTVDIGNDHVGEIQCNILEKRLGSIEVGHHGRVVVQVANRQTDSFLAEITRSIRGDNREAVARLALEIWVTRQGHRASAAVDAECGHVTC